MSIISMIPGQGKRKNVMCMLVELRAYCFKNFKKKIS